MMDNKIVFFFIDRCSYVRNPKLDMHSIFLNVEENLYFQSNPIIELFDAFW